MRCSLFVAFMSATVFVVSAANANSQRITDDMQTEEITLSTDFVEVEEAWMREHLRLALKNAAGYMTIKNVSTMDITLTGVDSEIAETTEVHEMSMTDDGIMNMYEVEEMIIPAGKLLTLEPGGKHIMFIGMKGKITQGDSPRLTLKFKNIPPVDITLDVEPFRTRRGHHDH